VAPLQNDEAENLVKFGGFGAQERQDEQIQVKFGMEAYAVGLLQHALLMKGSGCRNPPQEG